MSIKFEPRNINDVLTEMNDQIAKLEDKIANFREKVAVMLPTDAA